MTDTAPDIRRRLALDLLARHFGFDAFRPAQDRVVRSVLAGRDTLAVLPTGAGKSVCFQIPAMVLPGLTVVISPLLALMQDQVEAARARGVPARALNSLQSGSEQQRVLAELAEGAVRLLYVAPERGPRLIRELESVRARVGLLAVDEAHCIAEWGADFRPAYRALGRLRTALGNPPAVALTGSATPAVRSAIASVLGLGRTGGYDLHLASFDRRNLWFGVVPVKDDRERLARLLDLLATDDRIAIVYAPTRNQVESLARILGTRGYRAAAYHAGLTKDRRAAVLEAFLADQLEVVVATCAFGMGIDKPNVRLVVHWRMPATPESYYQEAGRAGRDGAPARCVLLHARTDAELPRRELAVTFPPRRLLESAWADPAAMARLPGNIQASAERLRRELRPERGRIDWRRVDARRRAAVDRIEAVHRYATDRTCRRAAVLAYFGERLVRCSGCDVCGEPVRPPLDPALRRRLSTLRLAVASAKAPWRAPLLDDRILAALAAHPPVSIDDLAGRPGVGPIVADHLGARILSALGSGAAVPAALLRPSPTARLEAWRIARARALGVAPFRVAPEALLAAIAERQPTTLRELARLAGVGPRFLALYGVEILGLLAGTPPGTGPTLTGGDRSPGAVSDDRWRQPLDQPLHHETDRGAVHVEGGQRGVAAREPVGVVDEEVVQVG